MGGDSGACQPHSRQGLNLMARTRLINPEFFLHEGLGKCSPHARLLFISLWTQADREGRLRWIPLRIHGDAFPHEPTLSVEKLGRELQTAGVLLLYSVEGRRFAHLPGFKRWQSPHRNETQSRVPPPPAGQPRVNQRTAKGRPDTSLIVSQSLSPQPLSPNTSSPPPDEGGRYSEESMVLALYLREVITDHSPQYSKKVTAKRLQDWSVTIDRLIRLDGANPEEVRRIITWAHVDEDGAFWRPNLLSASALRKQFSRLLLQSKPKKGKPEVDLDAAAVAAALDLGARL